MLTVLAFLVALGLLITVHEYGHYRVAVACGVKVLRFSIGFGKPLYTYVSPATGTEWVVGSLPLGGYVRMLDEREGAVPEGQWHQAFNRKPLWMRSAIVAAGPAANLILAILIYSAIGWVGVSEPKAVLSAPVVNSLAEKAGFQSGDRVDSIETAQGLPTPVLSFENFRWLVAQSVIARESIRVHVSDFSGQPRVLDLDFTKGPGAEDQNPYQAVGFGQPWVEARVESLMEGGAAQKAGLQSGDLVLKAFNRNITDAAQLRALIRSNPATSSVWLVLRNGLEVQVELAPARVAQASVVVGQVGAFIGGEPAMQTIRLNAWSALVAAVNKTWQMSVLSVQMIYKMLVGEASLKNLSGPLSIADYAGKSAQAGLSQYFVFLALLSVSLGVLNLLPLPVLDGGHLMYYLWEGVTGKPVSAQWMSTLQRGGVLILLAMMCIAFINDIGRLWG